MILGLDVSTSIVGATILDGDKIVLCEAWNLKKLTSIFEKAEFIKNKIGSLSPGIKHVFVEQPFTFFRSGGSSAKTMAKLQSFNGIVSWMCYDLLKLTPEYLTASQARKSCGIHIPRGINAKKAVIDFLLTSDHNFDIKYTRYGNPAPGENDRADSFVVAKAGQNICQKELKN